MKKALLIFLSALLLMAMPATLAQEGEPPFVPIEQHPALDIEINPPDLITRSLPTTEEVVVIEDSAFTVTSKGVTFKLEVPFGWYAFSQDVSQQMDAYMNYFADPRAALEYVFGIDLSLLMLNTSNSYQVLVYTRQNDLSKFFGSLADDKTYESAVAYFQKNAPDAGVEKAGIEGKNFIKTFQLQNDGNYSLIYLTYVNGAMLGFELLTKQPELTPEHDEVLKGIVSVVEIL